jgi:hypothetical protein
MPLPMMTTPMTRKSTVMMMSTKMTTATVCCQV